MRWQSLLILLVVFGAFLYAGAETNESNDNSQAVQLVFRTDSDTISYSIGEAQGEFTLSSLNSSYDTTTIASSCAFILLSRLDTLVVTPSNQPVNITILSLSDTIYETIRFTNDKLESLREYATFGDTPITGAGPFYYADSSDTLLAQLRIEYNLDSVAGNGDEIERILNLMRWAHAIVRHDGSSTNPQPRNALHIINVCREKDRGVNCRMIATILNEVYLSMGFKARHVTCLPKDNEDQDCHVTNMVFSELLNKWVYVDPSFNAYFMDEDSTLLGFSEIRKRIITGEPLLLPDGMDWNGQPKSHKEYMRYMTKNTFRFSCPLGSEAGYESKTGDRAWVTLNPSGFQPDKNGLADTTGSSGSLAVTCYTDNAEAFWSKP
jgi:hypothetical protein